ncbi:hypothetical protein BOTBODRAFT_108526 [Botryobasidium botryosum FD-172 SS1]|uniref:Putative lipoate-protein ligase A n=1 Tax=Botryobasidium botryosum (strain FD-172 SS1) TaxID=930990 RepID=A0A067MU71_BOTB1|nr:hypothetical protein BOTBODRAFT_108526 [Botryobasidium botryosum FD-172 SS1]
MSILRQLKVVRTAALRSAQAPTARVFSYQLSTKASKDPPVYVSASDCPYHNLAFEDWLFRKTDASVPLLFIYRNAPSVIIGRNQNPWKEINLRALNTLGIPFVRRKSGGGTVYHDLGNTNYSVSVPRESFDRRSNAELVAAAVRALGPPAYVNERHDICVDGYKICLFFSSLFGSAYKIIGRRAYHHGTMLISAKLDQLGDLLRNTKDTLTTKGVESVRSPVRNLSHFTPGIAHEAFVGATVREFRKKYGGNEKPTIVGKDDMFRVEDVRKGIEELQSWEWSHGQTPEFTHVLTRSFPWGAITAHMHSKHGLILDSTRIDCDGDTVCAESCAAIGEELVGSRYGDVSELISRVEGDGGEKADIRSAVLRWLGEEM